MKIIELEFLRGFVAFYIFLHHVLCKYIDCNIYISKLFIFGQEAVIIFFLLSGYVISLSQFRREYNFRTYFMHRFLRIYTVVILSIILSYIVFSYINNSWSIDFKSLILNLFMLQDKPDLKPGVLVAPIFHNEPLWSLSYEWWFYMIFFVHYKVMKYFNKRTLFFILTSFIVSIIGILTYKYLYNQASLFLMYYFIWASGASLYLVYKDKNKKIRLYFLKIILLCYMLLISIYFFILIYNQQLFHYVNHPILEIRHYLAAFFMIILVILYNKLGMNLKENKYIHNIFKVFSLFATISFAFYLVHYPIMLLFDSYDTNGYLKVLIMFITSVFISWLFEIVIYKRIILKIKRIQL
jgi:peptidoglycan/LPS O-acetylase OafA/YrhL